MRVVALLCLTGCFSKPPRPDGGDAGIGTGPRVIADQSTARSATASVTYSISVRDQEDRYLITTVQLGSDCSSATPSTQAVTAEGPGGVLPLAMIASNSGTPCGGATRSEQWALLAPPAVTLEITVTLDGSAVSLHSATIAFAGIDQASPTGSIVTASGESALATAQVEAEVGDLVLDTIGHGNTIERPGPQQKELFIRNIDTGNTLNNSAASTIAGGPGVQVSWEAAALDQWQIIATPLRPSGR